MKSSQTSGCGAAGSALDWGSRGRKFKSCHSDHVGASYVSLAPTFFKSQSALAPPLLLTKPDPLPLGSGLVFLLYCKVRFAPAYFYLRKMHISRPRLCSASLILKFFFNHIRSTNTVAILDNMNYFVLLFYSKDVWWCALCQ